MAEYVTDQVTKDWEKGKAKLYVHINTTFSLGGVYHVLTFVGWWISTPFIKAMKVKIWSRAEYLRRLYSN
jgi:hypothetical protein